MLPLDSLRITHQGNATSIATRPPRRALPAMPLTPSSRLAARLDGLSQLLEIALEIALARCEASPEVMNQAEATLANEPLAQRLVAFELALARCEASPEVMNQAEATLANEPLAQRLVEGVLLSIDLAPHLLAPLQLKDSAAAAVCSLWADVWKATKLMTFDLPQDLLTGFNDMAVIPGDDEQLVVSSGQTMRILDRSMSTVTSFSSDKQALYPITADKQTIYVEAQHDPDGKDEMMGLFRLTHGDSGISCSTKRSFKVRKCDNLYDHAGYRPVLAGGLLFCVLCNAWEDERADYFARIGYEEETDHGWDEIVALDAHSMEERYRFGLSLLGDARGLAVVGDELFVCDRGFDRLQVFSLTGEHRRSITGEWKWPTGLCFVKDRLYLVEGYANDQDSSYDPPYLDLPPWQAHLAGKRIFALSLQGDMLQVYQLDEGTHFIGSLVYFDGKLLAPYASASNRMVVAGIAALLATEDSRTCAWTPTAAEVACTSKREDAAYRMNEYRDALLLEEKGDLAAAAPLCREALDGLRKTLGNRHPRTLSAVANLGTLLDEKGDLTAAEPLLREALEGRRETLGDRHPSTLNSFGNLGLLLHKQGDLAAAVPLLLGARYWLGETIGSRHPSPLTLINSLTLLLQHWWAAPRVASEPLLELRSDGWN